MNEVERAGWEHKERNKHEETQFLFIHRLLCGRHFRAVLCNGIALLGIIAGIILRRR